MQFQYLIVRNRVRECQQKTSPLLCDLNQSSVDTQFP